MMSAPGLRAAANSKAGLMREAWLFAPEGAETRYGKTDKFIMKHHRLYMKEGQ